MISLSTKSHKNIFSTERILTTSAVFSIFLVASFVISCLFATIAPSNATTTTASAGSTAYSASISSDDAVSIPVTPTSEQATYITEQTISYTNTCPSGFTVTISSSSSNTNLTRTGSDSGTKTIPTTSSTGAALSDNTWGFSKVSGNGSFNPVPALASPVELFSTDSASTTAGTFPVYFGVKTDNNLPSGSYTNDVIYTVSVPSTCIAYTLKFNLNGGTGATGVDYSDQTLDYGTLIDLSTYTPTRTGYTFNGWTNGSFILSVLRL